MFAVLAHIRPLDRTTGERVDIYVSSAPGAAYTGLSGIDWEPAITTRPTGSIQTMALDLTAGVQVGSISVELSFTALTQADGYLLYWQDAPITIYRADDLVWPATIEFDGVVSSPSIDLEADTITLQSDVTTKEIEVDILTLTFTGDGASGGDPSFFGKLKPVGFGNCLNIQPVMFDTVRNIAMIDGYGNTVSIDWLAEGLSMFTAAIADYANYATLAAAIDAGTIAPGQWGTCVAEGLIVLGAPPVGIITCGAHFSYGMTGALMQRLVTTFAGVDPTRVDGASYAALDVAVPYPIHFWTSDQIQVRDLIEGLASPCNATPLITFQGNHTVTRANGGALAGEFIRNGFNEPEITQWSTKDVIEPFWQIKGRAGRPVSVLTPDQVNYYDTLVDRGLYSHTETYRQGNIVWLLNKSEWLYINPTPTAGNDPPDPSSGNSFWENLAPAPDASVLLYVDGTPIETLQPAEPGAQVTRSLNLDQSVITITLDASGSPVSGQLPLTFRATVSEANFDVTASSSFSISTSSGITATIDDTTGSPTKGQITLTALTGAGAIDVFALSGGVAMTQSITINTVGVLAGLSAVSTDLIETDAVTATVSLETTMTYSGSGTPPSTTDTTILSYTITPGVDTAALIFINGSLSFSVAADFAAAIFVNGIDIADVFAGSGIDPPGFSRQAAVTLTAGTAYTIEMTFRGSVGVTLAAGASMIIFMAKR